MGLNEKLLEKAKELDIDTDDFENDGDLEKAIKDIEEKKKSDDDDTDDLDKLKEKVKFLQEENKKAFASRDSAKKEKRAYQTKLDELEKKLKEAPDADELKKLKGDYTELKKFKEEVEKQREEEELKNKTESEKMKIRFEKEFEDLKKRMEDEVGKTKQIVEEKEKALKEKDSEIVSLRTAKLRAEIMEHAAKHNAYNPRQVARILQDDFDYDDKVNTFFFYERDSKGKINDELSVEEKVKAFLEDPENDNLVKSTAKGGTGHKEADTKNEGNKKTYSKSDKEKVKEAADFAGLDEDSYLDIQSKKEEKLKRIREKQQK